MKTIVVVLVLIFLSGCERSPVTSIPKEFQSQVGDFSHLTGIEVRGVELRFGVVFGNEAGRCDSFSGGQKVITVSEIWWNRICPGQRRGLIFHELGHCVLGRNHITNSISYMLSAIQDCPFYSTYRQELDFELTHLKSN